MTDAGISSLTSAAAWLQGALLGSVATALAVIAIATVGFLMLSGRLDWRRGVQTVIGCFILFGASSIAAGIAGAVRPSQADYAQAGPIEPFNAPVTFPSPSPPPASGQAKTICWTCGIAQDDQVRSGK
jgi:type IV secretion system protein VirB2